MKQIYQLRSAQIKNNAISFIGQLPVDDEKPLVIIIQERTRTLDQNAKLWSMLADIAMQVIWYGRKLTTTEWKHIFTAALFKQETVPGIDGGFVVLGQSTSKMKVGQLRDLIELIYSFGAERNVLEWLHYGQATLISTTFLRTTLY